MRILTSGLEALLLAIFLRFFSGPGIQLLVRLSAFVLSCYLLGMVVPVHLRASFIPEEKDRNRVQVDFTIAWWASRTVGMLQPFLIRNKDFKKHPGFVLTLLHQCKLGIFKVFLHLILAEIDEFYRRRVRIFLGRREGQQFLPNCTRGGRTPLIFLTRQKVYLLLACFMLVP